MPLRSSIDSRSGEARDPLHAFTERLWIRPVRLEDAAATAALTTEALSARLLTWPAAMTSLEAARRIRISRRATRAGEGLDLALIVRNDRRLAGWIGMRRISHSDCATLGYWLGEEFHGRGLMAEAAPAALPLFSRFLKVPRMRASVQRNHEASIAILKRLGMVPVSEGTIFSPLRRRHEPVQWFEGVLPPSAE